MNILLCDELDTMIYLPDNRAKLPVEVDVWLGEHCVILEDFDMPSHTIAAQRLACVARCQQTLTI